jgi:putative membrane protein
MMGWYGGWGMMGWFGGLFMLLLVIGLVALGILLARGFRPAERRSPPDTATEVLRHRFAAGEISQQEFEQLRQALDAASAAPHGSIR